MTNTLVSSTAELNSNSALVSCEWLDRQTLCPIDKLSVHDVPLCAGSWAEWNGASKVQCRDID